MLEMLKERVTELNYDYTQVAEGDREAVKRAAVDIKRREKRAAMDIVEIGRQLSDVKDRLERGQFPAWLETEFGWEQRMAYNFMAVADNFAKFAKIENFGLSALYLLSGPSVPDAAIEQANAVAATGTKVTHQVAKAIVEEHRPRRESKPVEQMRPNSIHQGTHAPVEVKSVPLPVIDLSDKNSGVQPLTHNERMHLFSLSQALLMALPRAEEQPGKLGQRAQSVRNELELFVGWLED